jgi:streptomycin 3"-adenylyltransferase
MSFPEPAESILQELQAGLQDLLGANLLGIYVYGSLTFGCYNPARSDIDVLVVTHRRLAPETRPPLSKMLQRIASPTKLEMSFLSRADLDPWRHPCPFDYHFSASTEVHDGTNVDLAAEIGNARARGAALLGPQPTEGLPQVPEADYLDTIVRDIHWARARIESHPGYAVLNCCRALAYARERQIMSKAEGAEWARRALPAEFHGLVEQALTAYTNEPGIGDDFDVDEVLRFSEWVEASIA